MIVVGLANQEVSNHGACHGDAAAMRAYTVACVYQISNHNECRGNTSTLAAKVAATGSRPARLAVVGACSLQFDE